MGAQKLWLAAGIRTGSLRRPCTYGSTLQIFIIIVGVESSGGRASKTGPRGRGRSQEGTVSGTFREGPAGGGAVRPFRDGTLGMDITNMTYEEYLEAYNRRVEVHL